MSTTSETITGLSLTSYIAIGQGPLLSALNTEQPSIHTALNFREPVPQPSARHRQTASEASILAGDTPAGVEVSPDPLLQQSPVGVQYV